MFRPGDRVGVAVSGGSDSVALLLLLVELQRDLGITLCVLHLNHMLRGAQSDKDEKFVKNLSCTLGLDFHSTREDVAASARRQKRNLEEAARTKRYEFFRTIVEAGRATQVAVAHSADDQAETVLAHLIRGTGPAGLGAIYPVAGVVVRPLLDVRRAELRGYLHRRKQTWREDRSNRDTTRTRARIRHKLLPLLESKFNPRIVGNLSRLSSLAREDELFWKLLVDDCFQAFVKKGGTHFSISVRDLLSPLHVTTKPSLVKASTKAGMEQGPETAALTKRLVRTIIAELRRTELISRSKKYRRQITSEHIEKILQLAKVGTSGHSLHLPGGIVVEREFDRILFFAPQPRAAAGREPQGIRKSSATHHGKQYEYTILLDPSGSATVKVVEIGSIFHLKVIDWPPLTSETRLLAAALDQALLRPPLLLRNWRPGDSYQPQGRKRTRKLKRLLLEKRVGLRDRYTWPVLTSAGALVWARGLPVSAEFAPRQGTKASLVIAEEAQ